jgi:hypothetical protein
LPSSASISPRRSRPSASSRRRSLRAAPAIALALGASGVARSQSVRRASLVASANGQKSRGETRWIVARISVA